MMTETMQALRDLQKKLYAFQFALNVIDFDAQTVAPSESYPGRGEALEVLSGIKYSLIADPSLPALLEKARSEERTEQEAAEVAELQRMYDETSKIPAQEYAAFVKLTTAAVNAWEKAKAASDFSLFAPYLEQIVAYRRRTAAYFDANKAPYDVWLDQYEKGLSMAQCDAFFDQLKAVIQPLVKEIGQRGAKIPCDFLKGTWPIEAQKMLSAAVMKLMGIDESHCVLSESEHPFTTEFYKGDVRITTHYHEDDMASNLYSVIHEGGHALYELHMADRLQYTCLSGGASMGLHESQSRLCENYLGRNLGFIRSLWPTLTELFPAQLAGVTPEAFYKAVNQCQPSLIRTEADEVTYCLHVMVRYELEKRLMDGSLAVKDLPAAWNAQMKELLGVEVPDDAHGVLQDIHWACGDLGYFPSYALGTAYGAQMMASMRKELDVDGLLEAGNWAPITGWLEERIWQYGKEKTPAQLLQNACGGAFDPKFYTDYLVEKYSAIYQL